MTAHPPTGAPVLDRRDVATLDVLVVLAALGAAAWLMGAAISVIRPLIGPGGFDLTLLAADGGSETLADGISRLSPETLAVTVDPSTLSGGALTLLMLERALDGLVGTVIAAAIAYTLFRIARGQSFHASLYAVISAAGVTLALGMVLSTGLGGLGRMMAGDELNTLLGTDTFAVGFFFSVIPVLIGFAVLGLAAVFRIGARLQRETDGLV